MKYVCVLPYAYKPYYDEFVKTCKLENVIAIDNTVNNIGIMKSHNMGVKAMREAGADYLITLSACLRFGESGGLDFIEQLEKEKPFMAHASGLWDGNGGIEPIALGWHFTAFSKAIFEKVGGWDTNFSNYGFDDVDLTIRIQKHFGKDYGLKVYPADFRHESTSHSISLADVKSPSTPRIMYFKRKWNKHPGEWQEEGYSTPFNLDVPLSYYPEPTDPLSIQNNEFILLGGDKDA